jgi:HTH-type transcriptional regulator/antitoxin HipB
METALTDIAELGAAIRRRRREQHLTQTDLADLADVSVVFVNEVEGGKQTAQVGRVFRLLKALGIDLLAIPR